MNRFCCFSLKTGGFFIVILELIAAIITGFYDLAATVAWTAVENRYNNYKSDPNDGLVRNILDEAIRQQVIQRIFIVKILLIAVLVICCLQIIFSFVLIHAIRKKSQILMTIWMVFKTIFILLTGVVFIVLCFNGITVQHILFFLFVIMLNAIFIKMVRDLKMNNKMDAYALPSHGKPEK